jgi:tRNA-Thr(GGU) m(6)t(6)A37 methyltransferase TsaA
MNETCVLRPVARIRSDFPSKFGIPRQSGLVPELRADVVFEPEFRSPDALRGIDGFSHLWLIWEFSESARGEWSPTVRPPRLGGNTRLGVFATRSPFRPNPLGLSSVKLESVELSTPDGPVLRVSGADLMDGTPIFDIKPYVPYADCHADASGGFTRSAGDFLLSVDFPSELLSKLPAESRAPLLGVLSHDPRPSYQRDEGRVYGFVFAGFEIKFTVSNDGRLSVVSAEKAQRFTPPSSL